MSFDPTAAQNGVAQRFDAESSKWVSAGFYNHANVGHPTTPLPVAATTVFGIAGPLPIDNEANAAPVLQAGHGVNISNPTTVSSDT